VGKSDTRGNRGSYKEELVTADQKTEDDVATTGKVEHTYIRANELEEVVDRASSGRLERRKAEIGKSR
jgi:hypothetical protein